jgi:DNA helicase-2/ATP-dependent DNA helicase PcrA
MLYVTMLQESGYLSMWQMQGESEADRVDNLRELESTILRFEQNSVEEPTLSGFLEEQALLTDIDNYNTSADTCVLMTMHAAKGLEFPVVFLPGFEDGVFPGLQTIYNPDELEEERRLCYVAITRAREQLYLLRAESRMLYGTTTRNRQSRFLGDIPQDKLKLPEKPKKTSYSGFGTGYRTETTRAAFPKSPATSSVPRAGTTYKAPAAPSAPTVTYTVGQQVEHTAFGVGSIEAVQPMGNDTMLTIRFGVGTKKLMAAFAKLKILD